MSSYRFGVFEVDVKQGEVRKQGLRIRLRGRPFEILAILLERPGEMVSREELRARLWAADTFVDFDHGLNTSVNRLREVLGDSADNPRFIETVPRKGYRFIAPVHSAPDIYTPLPTPAGAPEPAESPPRSDPSIPPGGSPPARRRSFFWLIAAAAVVIAAVTGAFAWWRATRPVDAPGGAMRLVVLPF